MSLIKKPMLSASMENSKGEPQTLANLTFPLYGSIKLDGIRCLTQGGKALSRTFKKIPNLHVQAQMVGLPDDLDGELTTYNADGSVRTFSEIQSDIMSEDGTPNFRFEIFDYVKDDLNKQFNERLNDLKALYPTLPAFCILVDQVLINDVDELNKFESEAVSAGHEGIMTRLPTSPYKCGRATWNSQYLIKVKRFVDSEAIILGFGEKMSNENEAEKDELGHTKRSSAKAGLVPANTLGKFFVSDIHDGREFEIGTGKGLDDALRKKIWDNREEYLGKTVNYRYQEVGTKDLPRIPSFQGFRDPIDIGEPNDN